MLTDAKAEAKSMKINTLLSHKSYIVTLQI